MARKTKKTQPSALELAVQLAEVRLRIAEDTALNKTLTTAFKRALESEQLTEAGNYAVAKVYSYKVAVEELAMPFALERGLVKIDTGAVHDVFRRDINLRFADPVQFGFEEVSTEKVVPIKKSSSEEQ